MKTESHPIAGAPRRAALGDVTNRRTALGDAMNRINVRCMGEQVFGDENRV